MQRILLGQQIACLVLWLTLLTTALVAEEPPVLSPMLRIPSGDHQPTPGGTLSFSPLERYVSLWVRGDSSSNKTLLISLSSGEQNVSRRFGLRWTPDESLFQDSRSKQFFAVEGVTLRPVLEGEPRSYVAFSKNSKWIAQRRFDSSTWRFQSNPAHGKASFQADLGGDDWPRIMQLIRQRNLFLSHAGPGEDLFVIDLQRVSPWVERTALAKNVAEVHWTGNWLIANGDSKARVFDLRKLRESPQPVVMSRFTDFGDQVFLDPAGEWVAIRKGHRLLFRSQADEWREVELSLANAEVDLAKLAREEGRYFGGETLSVSPSREHLCWIYWEERDEMSLPFQGGYDQTAVYTTRVKAGAGFELAARRSEVSSVSFTPSGRHLVLGAFPPKSTASLQILSCGDGPKTTVQQLPLQSHFGSVLRSKDGTVSSVVLTDKGRQSGARQRFIWNSGKELQFRPITGLTLEERDRLFVLGANGSEVVGRLGQRAILLDTEKASAIALPTESSTPPTNLLRFDERWIALGFRRGAKPPLVELFARQGQAAPRLVLSLNACEPVETFASSYGAPVPVDTNATAHPWRENGLLLGKTQEQFQLWNLHSEHPLEPIASLPTEFNSSRPIWMERGPGATWLSNSGRYLVRNEGLGRARKAFVVFDLDKVAKGLEKAR